MSAGDLAAFLKARLDEDEHWAQMAEAGWPPENALAASEDPEHYPFMATDITPSKATFIRRHDPARVLREVKAKRALLHGHEGVHRCDWGEHRGGEFGPCKLTRTLAAVYSDHPDYRQEWVVATTGLPVPGKGCER